MNARTRSGAALCGAMALLVGCGAGDDAPLVAADATVADAARPADVARSTDAPAAPPDVATPARDASAGPDDVGDLTPDMQPDGGVSAADVEPAGPAMGATMRVTASSLNLRSGAGTASMILTAMPCGAQVTVVGGPSSGWWNVRYGAATGWASGAYLVADAAFDAATCGGGTTTPPATPPGGSLEVARVFELARSAVGYSYYWGHGSWGTDGAAHGSCSGSCPSCTHSGRYGADCSGFVAKVWQVPSPSPVTTDAHPYSTYDFFNSTRHWTRVARDAMRPGDALVYNANGAGHIVLFESGSDPWGSIWTFEARGCATGVVHNLRTAGSAFVAIRREGL